MPSIPCWHLSSRSEWTDWLTDSIFISIPDDVPSISIPILTPWLICPFFSNPSILSQKELARRLHNHNISSTLTESSYLFVPLYFPSFMSALRRLSEEDVKLVFDCVFNNHPPPPTLSFQIIIVGSNGMKLSPPSYEYKGRWFGN
jgi:hypothetical protein